MRRRCWPSVSSTCGSASAMLLNHSLVFPLLGYQIYLNPHHNNLLASLLTAGGGFLNNHHANPAHPYHAVLPYELDPSSLLLRLLAVCGLSGQRGAAPARPARAGGLSGHGRAGGSCGAYADVAVLSQVRVERIVSEG